MTQKDSEIAPATPTEGDATMAAPLAGDATQKGIQAIAAEVDFKPYLDAVNVGSQRTRFLIYVLIAALLLMLTAYRDTAFPDWINSRITQLQLASACLRDKDARPECVEPVEYAKSFVFGDAPHPGLFDEKSDDTFREELRDELQAHITELIQRRAEALTLHLPFFGLAIDMNDVGLIGGLLLSSILFVLYASLSSETDSLERARKKAKRLKDDEMRGDYLELLLMSQVLSSPSKGRIGIGKGLYILFGFVALVHLWFSYDDIGSYHTAVILEGKWYAGIDTFFEWVFCILVLLFSVLCIYQQKRLNESVRRLM